MAEHCFGDGDPWIAVTEDPCVLLVPRRIGSYLAEFEAVSRVRRLLQHDAVLGVEVFFYAPQRCLRLAGLQADAGHDAHALRLDEYPAFVTVFASDRETEGVIGSSEPFSIPSGVKYHGTHFFRLALDVRGFLVTSDMCEDVRKFDPILHVHAGDENALGDRSLARSGDLETLARVFRETVQVQAVVPVRASDERKGMRSQMCCCIYKTPFKMLQKGSGVALVAVKSARLIEDAVISGLFQIGGDTGDQPERVVVKAASHCRVAALRQRLVLMVGAAVRTLRVGDIDDPLPRSFGDQVDESEKILARIAESHAASETALVVAGRSAHVESDHALILVPDVDGSVEFFVSGRDFIT